MSAREDGIKQLSLPNLENKVGNQIRLGSVMAVDLAAKRVRIKSGNIESGWLPWPAGRAGSGKRRWDPPEVDEQVLMLSPSGDLSQAIAFPGIYQDDFDAPSSDGKEDLAEYDDGTVIGYNRETHTLTANLGPSSIVMNRDQIVLTVGSTSLTMTAAGSVFEGPVTVNGLLTYTEGLAGSGGGTTAVINGNMQVNGNQNTTGNITNGGNITSGGVITDSNGDGGA